MSSRNLYIAATTACMTGALFGYSVGFIGGVLVLPSFLHHFQLDKLQSHDLATAQSQVVSCWLVGCVIGVPLSVPICSRFGRRSCIAFSAGLYIFGACLQLLNIHERIEIFEIGRLINGIGVGAGTLVSPVYISEISTPSLRGTLLSGYQVAIQIFALIGFWGAFICNSAFDKGSNLQWQVPVIFQLLPGAMLLIGSAMILPESPQWLILMKKRSAAKKSLAWLRMADEDGRSVTDEMDRLLKVNAARELASTLPENKSFIREILTPPLRKRMLVGSGIMIWQNLVGLNALNYFSPIIFFSAGFTSVSASLFLTGLFGLVKVVAAFLFMFVFVRVKGNRFWLLFGSGCMAVAMFVLALCIQHMPTDKSAETTGFNWYGLVAVLSVYVFAAAFGVSLGPISWNVASEIFPAHIITKACAITTCIQWLSQILIASITPPLIAAIGYKTYLLYGTFCVLALFWCAFFVPETRGVPFGPEMDRVWGDTPKVSEVVQVIEADGIEETDEFTPLIAKHRRRSSVALVV